MENQNKEMLDTLADLVAQRMSMSRPKEHSPKAAPGIARWS